MDITLDGATVHIGTGGVVFEPARPTLLFLHGSGLDHRGWALQARYFAHRGFGVLAPDFAGHSLSGGAAFETIEATAPWLDQLLEATGVAHAHVIGHSQGFLSALELAHQFPQRVKSLCAIGTGAAIPVNPALIEMAEKSAPEAAAMMCNWGFGPAIHMGASPVPGMQPIAHGRAIMGTNPLAADLKACNSYRRGAQVASDLKNIPACCIIADKDKMTPLKAGRSLAAALGVTPTELGGFGHMLPIEAPRQIVAAIEAFMAGQA